MVGEGRTCQGNWYSKYARGEKKVIWPPMTSEAKSRRLLQLAFLLRVSSFVVCVFVVGTVGIGPRGTIDPNPKSRLIHGRIFAGARSIS